MGRGSGSVGGDGIFHELDQGHVRMPVPACWVSVGETKEDAVSPGGVVWGCPFVADVADDLGLCFCLF